MKYLISGCVLEKLSPYVMIDIVESLWGSANMALSWQCSHLEMYVMIESGLIHIYGIPVYYLTTNIVVNANNNL